MTSPRGSSSVIYNSKQLMSSNKLNHMKIHFFAIVCYIFLGFISSIDVSMATDSLNNSQSVTVNEPLISSQKEFQLGFFNLNNSSRFYLGIWYNIPDRTIVWIANRDNPLNDTSGALRIGNDGNLILVDKTETIVWSTSIKNLSSRTTVARLLDSGNLVLRDSNEEGSVLWQSFDHPSHAIIAGMKLGWDLRTGLNRFITSWKTSEDPSSGEYTFGIDRQGLPEAIIWEGRSSKRFRSGPWNGVDFGGLVVDVSLPFTFEPIVNSEEVWYRYSLKSNSSLIVADISYLGVFQIRSWDNSINNWRPVVELPEDSCGTYGICGANSMCTIRDAQRSCSCLIGYSSEDSPDGSVSMYLDDCIRKYPLNCSEGEDFVEYTSIKIPDLVEFWLNTSMSLEECKVECLKNCSCTAYANSNATDPGHGCILWFGDLIDVRKLTNYANQKLYIRVTASDLESESEPGKGNEVIVIAVTITASILLLLAVSFLIWKRKSNQQGTREESQFIDKENIELPYFDIATVAKATQNFSNMNKIGEGGFGPVYKGVLSNGQQIAVKRLSENSVQGLNEWKNEIMLIAKLQHRNLVRLLGCCIEGEERMLIYEYMPNGSLDSYIFGGSSNGKKHLLVWKRRFSIIVGIARGLLYLHRDSRLRIIHRDLKASNVLVDSEINPKISDFGMARAFGEEQLITETKRVVGTYGYMAPEYAFRGIFSMKSDVFSFGVLILEIISGRRNSQFYHPDHDFNMLEHAWKLWIEERAYELVDPLMEDSFPISEVLRCIQIGLLCVQQRPDDRPLMSSVLLLLDSEITILPQPKRPGFSTEKSLYDESDYPLSRRLLTTNDDSDTIMEGR